VDLCAYSFLKYRNSYRGRMYPPPFFGFRDTLPTVASGFVCEELGNVSTACTEDQDAGVLI